MSFAEVGQCYRKNEPILCSIALSSLHPEYMRFFLYGGLLGTTDSQIPRVYCTTWYLSNQRRKKK
jgi:hypothetical protein